METVVGVALVFAGLAMLGMGLPPLHCSPIFCMQVAYLHICPLGISGGIDVKECDLCDKMIVEELDCDCVNM